jgi:hypothetical protein
MGVMVAGRSHALRLEITKSSDQWNAEAARLPCRLSLL